jgi:hypothetical protein
MATTVWSECERAVSTRGQDRERWTTPERTDRVAAHDAKDDDDSGRCRRAVLDRSVKHL